MNFGARRIRRPVVAERSVRLMRDGDRREVIAGADKTNVVYHGNSRGDNFGEEENLAVRKGCPLIKEIRARNHERYHQSNINDPPQEPSGVIWC